MFNSFGKLKVNDSKINATKCIIAYKLRIMSFIRKHFLVYKSSRKYLRGTEKLEIK